MQQEVGSNALIFNLQGEFLLVKRSDDDEYFAGYWELPGGGVDGEETPQESLKREILEECGLSVSVGQPVGVHIFALKDNTIKVSEITFLCKLLDVSQSVTLSHEHSEYKWTTKEQVKELELSEYMGQVIVDALANLTVGKL